MAKHNKSVSEKSKMSHKAETLLESPIFDFELWNKDEQLLILKTFRETLGTL